MTAKNEGNVLRTLAYAIGAHSAKKLVQVTLPFVPAFFEVRRNAQRHKAGACGAATSDQPTYSSSSILSKNE
jgi:hypothetical protein